MSAESTGEASAAGSVYRLPSVEVRGVRSVELAIADLIDRALERRPSTPPPARPDA